MEDLKLFEGFIGSLFPSHESAKIWAKTLVSQAAAQHALDAFATHGHKRPASEAFSDAVV